MTSLTDPKGNETTWDYTVADQVTMTDPMGNTEVKHYDSQGNLDYVLDRDDKLTTYEYDSNNNLTTEVMYDGPTDAADVEDTLTWTYTPDGKIKTAENGAGTYTFQYNDAGQVVHVDEPFGVGLTMAYDTSGNRILVADSLGGTETSLYDANNLLVRRTLVQDDVTMRVDFTYDQYGRVLTHTRYSDAAGTELVATTTYTYDPFGNVASIVNTDADSATIDEFDYTFDAGGNLTSETDMQAGIDSGTPWTNDYTFDAQNQLTGDGTNSYDYDTGGNRETGNTYYQNPDDVHYTNEIETDGTWHYYYDANGNTTKKVAISGGGTWVYGYDNANHLILAEQWSADPDVYEDADLELSVTYKYNAFGEQIEEDVGGTAYRKFVIDGWNPALPTPVGNENQEVLAQLNVSNSETIRYLMGDQVDQELGRIDFGPATPSWTLTDHLGSVRDVVANDGTINDSIVYDSFGTIANESDSAYRGWYAYTGRELDTEIDLQYNHARWYDSSTGRWISQDPMGFDAGDSNLYRYVKNSPLDFVDANGNWRWRLVGDQVLMTSEKDDTLKDLISMGYPAKRIEATAAAAGKELGAKLESGYEVNITSNFSEDIQRALSFQNSLPRLTADPDPRRGVGNCYGFVSLFLQDPAKTLKSKNVSPWDYLIGPLKGNPVAGIKPDAPKSPQMKVVVVTTVKDELSFFLDLSTAKGYFLYTPEKTKVNALINYVNMPGIFTDGRKQVNSKATKFGDIAIFNSPIGMSHAAVVLGHSRDGKAFLFQKMNSLRPYTITAADDPSVTAFGASKFWQKK